MRAMAPRKTNPIKAECRKLLRDYPDTLSMELLVADMHGFLRGKRIQADDIEKVCESGFTLCAGICLLTGLGYTVPGFPYSEADGDPDMDCFLVPGSLAPVPWSERPMTQAMFRFVEDDGSPFFADPRTVLENALAPLRKMNVTPVMATELEFYLLSDRSDAPEPGTPRVPGTGSGASLRSLSR